ncbi:MAG: O-antigen ligase family protein [Firmicutes bacterium]|nr:O-antigen ligase family protein [Bacillota bacterium]
MSGDRNDKEKKAKKALKLDEKGVKVVRGAEGGDTADKKSGAPDKTAASSAAGGKGDGPRLSGGTAAFLSGAGSFLSLLPAIVFSAVVILLVRTYTVTRPMGRYFWSSVKDDTILYDTFSYFKMVVIVICAVMALTVILLRAFVLKNHTFKWSRFYIPAAVYTVCIVLSYAFSDFKDISWLGAMDRFEGTLPMLCYMVMLFFITQMIRSERDLKLMLWPLGISLVILGALGVSQATGHDFFQTIQGQKLITPFVDYGDGVTSWTVIDKMAIEGESMYSFNFTSGEVYETVYNINYVPFYLTLVLPVFAMIFVRAFERTGRSVYRWAAGVLALGIFGISLYCFFGANSASGYFGLVIIVLLGLIVFRKKLIRWAAPLAIIVLVAALVMSGLQERWLPEVKKMLADAGQVSEMVIGTVSAADEAPQPSSKASEFTDVPNSKHAAVDRIVTGENWITMRIRGNTLAVMIDGSGLSFYDDQGEPIELALIEDGNNYYRLLDERFHNYVKTGYELKDDDLYVVLVTDKTTWRFHYVSGEGFKYVTPVSTSSDPKEVSIGPIPSIGFEGNYRFGSQRGLIWSRTLPLLKSRILLGSGPDTFCFVFPQEDYAAKYTYYNNINTIVDKPHNIYLLNAVNTGCISMLAFIAMIGWVLVDCLRHSCRMRGLRPLAEYVGSGIFLGIAAFAVVGLFNDTTVSVSPLFWSMMGMGYACNRIVEEAERTAPKAEDAGQTADASETEGAVPAVPQAPADAAPAAEAGA